MNRYIDESPVAYATAASAHAEAAPGRSDAHAGRRPAAGQALDGPGDEIIRVRRRPDHIVVVPSIVAIAAGGESTGITVEFATGGRRGQNCRVIHIIGMRGSVRDDTAGAEAAGDYELASMAFSIVNQHGTAYISDGSTGSSFVRMWDLFRDNPAYDLDIIVPTEEKWTIVFRNLQPAATGHSLFPSLAFECLLPVEGRAH